MAATTQKQRWANRAERLTDWANRADAKASAIIAGLPDYVHDVAFVTQPGAGRLRTKITTRERRAYDLQERARTMRDKAANLATMASRNAGDAERKRQATREKISAAIAAGDFVSCIYGVREVLKVNAKSFRIAGDLGPITIDKSLCRKVVSSVQEAA